MVKIDNLDGISNRVSGFFWVLDKVSIANGYNYTILIVIVNMFGRILMMTTFVFSFIAITLPLKSSPRLVVHVSRAPPGGTAIIASSQPLSLALAL